MNVGTIFCLIGLALLAISIVICLKSETGKSLSQTTCLWLGEIFSLVGVLLTFLCKTV